MARPVRVVARAPDKGLATAGHYRGASRDGAYDLAGSVREWTRNAMAGTGSASEEVEAIPTKRVVVLTIHHGTMLQCHH